VELLHFSHFHHVSLVQWTNHLLPATGGNSLRLGVQPTLWNCYCCLATAHVWAVCKGGEGAAEAWAQLMFAVAPAQPSVTT
jgi:hypothetical protein